MGDSKLQSKREQLVAELIQKLGGTYASALGIDLAAGTTEEVFKWFLASVLFGARIGEGLAIKTYREFERAGVLSPQAILRTGWQGLVDILDQGGYARYDFKTATKLLDVMGTLEERYAGDLNRLCSQASNASDLEQRLQGLGKGIGPVTVSIFLRELRGIWPEARPRLSEAAVLAAIHLKLIETCDADQALARLEEVWKAGGQKQGRQQRFSDFEAALVRLGKNFCRKKRYATCPMAECPRGSGRA